MQSPTTPEQTRFVTSTDGTTIAYEVHGAGPVLVLVDGALCHRRMGPSGDLSKELADAFTVVTYDRRGRGDSVAGNGAYDVRREIEDLEAVIDANGGRAHLLAISSGAALALEAARQGAPVDGLVCYEVPFVLDGSRPPADPALPEHVRQLVDRGRRGAAVAAFMKLVGVPAPVRAFMRVLPVWRTLTAVAHTIPYDLSLVVPFMQGGPLPEGHYAAVASDTLVLAGGKSPEHMRSAQAALADALPRGRLQTLPGQTHMVKAEVVGPVVRRHLLG